MRIIKQEDNRAVKMVRIGVALAALLFLFAGAVGKVVGSAFTADQFIAAAGSGTNGLACATNGCRIDFGAGANDYANSDGTTVTYAGPLNSAGEIKSTGAAGDFRGLEINNNPYCAFINPTVSAGFGTSPSVGSGGAGTCGFTITVGSGGTANTGTISFSTTATTGWICDCTDITTPGGNDTKQTGGSTTTATMGNFATSTGSATAWTAGDVLRCRCSAY